MRTKGRLVGCLLLALALAGCGGRTAAPKPSAALQRHVARSFAATLLRGDTAGARALLVRQDDQALNTLVRLAIARQRGRHASIRAGRRSGDRWTFAFVSKRAHPDGSFERQQGELAVVVAPSASGAGVRFFAFENVQTVFSTHHDSQLPPSKR